MRKSLVAEVKISTAIVAELVLGFLTWLLVIGLLPADNLNFNVVGSVVMAVVCGIPYWLAHQYVKAYQGRQTR